MCGRYVLDEVEQLADRFKVGELPDNIPSNFNVSPSHVMPVIVEDDKGRHIEFMKWGIPKFVAKDTIKALINTKAESAFKPTWNKHVLHQRCLVPAVGFYEWLTKKDEPKKPYFIHMKNEDIFAFAGVWSTWKDENQKEWKVYSIMTTEPNKEMSAIHNRAPIMLHQEDESSWLKPSSVTRDSIEPLLRPLEDNGLEMWEVSSDVGNPRNNYKELMLPVHA